MFPIFGAESLNNQQHIQPTPTKLTQTNQTKKEATKFIYFVSTRYTMAQVDICVGYVYFFQFFFLLLFNKFM